MKIKTDQIIRTHRKSIALIIQADGNLVIRAPMSVSHARIQQFVDSKIDWIHTQQGRNRDRQPIFHEYIEGEVFYYLGKSYPLKLVDRQSKPLILKDYFSLRRAEPPEIEKTFLKWYRQQGRNLFTERVDHFAHKYSYNYGKIRLSSARTRWGSCSSKGTLSFTWRLILAPPEIIDYVILHELVHLEIQNHSAAFWNKVQCYLPDYKKRRLWLKEQAFQLTLNGK